MRRMFSENQIKDIVKESPSEVVEALKGQDISVEGITSKGIANTGDIGATGKITGGEIIENMSGYSFTPPTSTHRTFENWYAGVTKTGNKITFVISVDVTQLDTSDLNAGFGAFTIPSSIGEKLYPSSVGGYYFLDNRQLQAFSSSSNLKDCPAYINKTSNSEIRFVISLSSLTANTKYHIRYEATFLLSENLASE